MMWGRRLRRMGPVGAVLVLFSVVVGCVAVPTAGPVRKVEGQRLSCQNCVNVEVAPPSLGDDPERIVNGYLRATSNYQPNYSVAKLFLTKAAVERWSPEAEARIYRRGSVSASGNRVVLDGQLIGALDGHRSYSAKGEPLTVSFRLAKEEGEWRIAAPPPGLLIAESSFTRFYSSYSLHFVSSGHLVPDPVYLPNRLSQANIASALIKALLAGPSEWLRPAVMSAIPPGTALIGDAVTITDGVANVPLNDPVLQLDDQQRVLMAAQVMYTLREAAVGIKGVLFTVNQQPLRVPGGDVNSVLTAEEIPYELDPIPFAAGDQLYAVRNGAVQMVQTGSTPPAVEPVDGDLGKGRFPVDSLAVSFASTDLAVVSDDRTALRWGTTESDAKVRTVLSGTRNLLRPQFSRHGELWVIDGTAGKQRMWAFRDDSGPIEVAAAELLGQGEVTAFRISPDGSRMALIRKLAGSTQLGLARINRGDRITVDGWRPLDTTQSNQPQLVRLQDVAWIDATELMVLGSPSSVVALQTYRISQDASRITGGGESTSRDAVELSVLLRTQTAIVVSGKGQSYRIDAGQWTPFIDKVSTVAYPG
jgi:Lipoprotein LpqB beta-propeller domain/Sporulation and spore germination